MQIFKNNKSSFELVKEKPFKLEKDIQTVFEKNLKLITNLTFVKSEFTIKNNRIDTLAFDEETKSFVIIEYKKDKNYSVIDQGVSYLNLMLDYKSDFIVEHNETLKTQLKRADVDWSQSRVIFVSPFFTDNQKQSTNFKDLSIELMEIKQFENDIIIVNPINKSKSAPSIKQIQTNQDSEINKIAKELKTYDEEYHLSGKSDELKELYEAFKNGILSLPANIEVKPQKLYITFRTGKNICDITLLQKGIKIWINMPKGSLKDEKKIMRDVSKTGHWGNGDYELTIYDTCNFEYSSGLITESL